VDPSYLILKLFDMWMHLVLEDSMKLLKSQVLALAIILKLLYFIEKVLEFEAELQT
jgi:hypothetical protein